ncbi:MAG: glycosyltransferase family 9 protein [Nitrospinales bacterium]
MEKILKNAVWRLLGLLFQHPKERARPALDLRAVRSVLAIRPDRLGDVILSTPVYESLKQAFPEIRLSVLVNQNQREILSGNPFIDNIICWNPRRPLSVVRDLNKETFDLAIVLNQAFSATAATLALLSGAAFRVGYENRQSAWVYNISVPRAKEIKHEIQHNLDVLRFLGISSVRDAPRVDFDAALVRRMEGELEQRRRHQDRPLVLVKPGTRVPEWGWDLEKFRTVCECLQESRQAEVFIICGPGEEKWVASFARSMLNQPVILPALSTRELAFLIKRADLLLCNHTGIMHLASAVRTPVVAIFKHGDVKRWGPYQTRSAVLEERGGDALSPEKVLETIGQILAR